MFCNIYSQTLRLFIFLLHFQIYGQNSFKGIDNFFFNREKGLFEVWTNDSIYYFDTDIKLNSTKRNDLSDIIDVSSFNEVKFSSSSILVSNGSGLLVDEDRKNINEYSVKNFFINSLSFIHNDTIFKIGGYGFWTKYKGLSYYNRKVEEWMSYELKSSESYDGILSPHIVKIGEDDYLIYGGKSFEEENPLREFHNQEIYLLDMKNKSINKYGSLLEISNGREISLNEPLFLMKEFLIQYDWKGNSLKKYRFPWTFKVDRGYNLYYIGDKVFFIQRENENLFISSNDFFIDYIEPQIEGPIFENGKQKYKVILYYFFFGVLIYLILRWVKTFNILKVEKNRVKFRFKTIDLSYEDTAILNEVFTKGSISTSKIHNMLSSSDIHPNHLYRIISAKMNSLTIIIQVLINNDCEVFTISKNRNDKRIKDYVLTSDVRRYL